MAWVKTEPCPECEKPPRLGQQEHYWWCPKLRRMFGWLTLISLPMIPLSIVFDVPLWSPIFGISMFFGVWIVLTIAQWRRKRS